MNLSLVRKSYGSKLILSLFHRAIFIGIERLPNCSVVGIESECQDGTHVILLDYDKISEDALDEILMRLINTYSLSPFYVFLTERDEIGAKKVLLNVLVVSLTKVSFGDAVSIIKSSGCDTNFQVAPRYQYDKSWAIRMTTKGKKPAPTFLKIIGDKNLEKRISGAHLRILEQWYSLPKLNYSNIDDSDCVSLVTYQTTGD